MEPIFRSKLKSLLIHHEKLKLLPYTDITGNITIGCGRNLSVRGITEPEAFVMLDDDMLYFTTKLTEILPWFDSLDQNRQIALIDMAFNLGLNGLLSFHDMLSAMEQKDYKKASICAMQSKWATQVGQRAIDISSIILTGEIVG